MTESKNEQSRKEFYERWVNIGSFQPISPLVADDLYLNINQSIQNNQCKILDFGGGDPTGAHPPSPNGPTPTSSFIISQYLANKYANIQYDLTVVDAKGNQPDNPKIHFQQGDIQNVQEMVSGKFDLITSINVLQEPSLSENILNILGRLLSDSGKVYFVVPGVIIAGEDLVSGIDSMIKGYQVRRFDLVKIHNWLKESGLKSIKIETINPNIIFDKPKLEYLLGNKRELIKEYLFSNLEKASEISGKFGQELADYFNGTRTEVELPALFYKITAIKIP